MSMVVDDVFRSANGDNWQLVRDTVAMRSFVRHEAIQLSGGKVTDMSIEDFLSGDGSGPEHAHLRRTIDQLGLKA